MSTHILVVDDNPATADLVQRLLTTPGRRVVAARTVADARAHVVREPVPDLAIIDRMLPDGSGLVFCREVKASQPLIPVIIMTAYARGGPVQEAHARACGADGFAPKPVDLDALRATVARLVRRPKAG